MSDSPGAAAENSARALKVISASPSPTLSAACGSDTPAHTAADECAQRRTRARSHFRRLTSSQLRRRLTSFQASDHTEVLSRSFEVGPGSVLRVGVGPRQLLEVLKKAGVSRRMLGNCECSADSVLPDLTQSCIPAARPAIEPVWNRVTRSVVLVIVLGTIEGPRVCHRNLDRLAEPSCQCFA